MGTKGICLLVVNDDLTCRSIVVEMLQSCTYEVLHVGRALDTLSAICERKDRINIVLTNLHRIQAQGSRDILHHIQKKLNLPTFLMSPDDIKIELKGQESSFAAYFLMSLNINDIDNLWEFASVKAIEDSVINVGNKDEESAQMDSISQNINIEKATTSRENTPSNRDHPQKHRKRKRKKTKEKSEKSEASGDDEQAGEKKTRIVWTDELRQKFLEAMEIIHPEKPVPKRIVEVMNMPSLRREHVASHLQKYRISLKKAEKSSGASNYGMNLTNHVGEPSFSSWHSSENFNSLPRNPNATLQPYWNGKAPFHQGTLGIKSMAASSNLHPYSISSRLSRSSTMSNLRPSSMVEGNNYQGTFQQLRSPNLSSSTQALLMSQKSNDWRGRLLQRQLKYGPRNIVNSGFRVYGDQTKNMMFSIQGSSSMSIDDTLTESSKSEKSFMGFRLTNEGKSLEFGGTSASGNNIVLRTEISSVGTSEVQNQGDLDHELQPPPATNNFHVPSTASLPQNSQCQNQGSGDNYPSNSLGCNISQLVSSMENTVIHSPSLPVDPRYSQKHLPSPKDLCTTPEIQEAIQLPSIPANKSISLQQQTFLSHLEYPAYCYSSIQSSPFPASTAIEQQPYLPPLMCAPENEYSVQYPTTLGSILDDPLPPSGNGISVHSSSMYAPQQEINVPLFRTSGIDASVQEPLTSIQQNPQQESSMPSVLNVLNSSWPDGNFSALMNETESSCHQLYWHGDFDLLGCSFESHIGSGRKRKEKFTLYKEARDLLFKCIR